jgi:hypothetical protein
VLLWVAVLGLKNEILEVTQIVGLKMGKKGGVVLMLEGVTEGELIERNFFRLLRLKFVGGDHLFVPKAVGLEQR